LISIDTNTPKIAVGGAAAISALKAPGDAQDHDDDKQCPSPEHQCQDCGGKDQIYTTGKDSGCENTSFWSIFRGLQFTGLIIEQALKRRRHALPTIAKIDQTVSMTPASNKTVNVQPVITKTANARNHNAPI